jgi:hypothetical protein
MNLKTILVIIIPVMFQCFLSKSQAQQFSNYEKGVDTVAVEEYKQVMPIWGKKAIEKGFDLPEPIGIATNYMHFKQGLLLENILVGFDGVNSSKDPVNLDDF